LRRLLDELCSDEQLAELGSNVLYAVNYDNRARLDSDIVEKLFAQQIKTSATRLSTFAACPYKYFARYLLELKERREFKLRPLDVGDFYHRVLDAWLKRFNEEKKDFITINEEELLKLLRGQIEKLITEDSFISNFARHRDHDTFIINIAREYLEDCVLAIAQMVREGSFRPRLSEVSFGEVKDVRDTLGEYELALAGNRVLSLGGKIDRLDIADLDGEKAAIVFDYKRRDTSFSWSKFYYGLDMQLPIYMLAVRNATNAKTQNVVGAFYMPVETKVEGTVLDEIPRIIEKFHHKANGIFNGDFFQQLDKSNSNKFYNFFVTKKGDQYGYKNKSGALRPDAFEGVLRFTHRKIIALAEEILSGEIDIKPYRLNQVRACTNCEYMPVCRFDWQINDYNFLESINKLQALEKIGTR